MKNMGKLRSPVEIQKTEHLMGLGREPGVLQVHFEVVPPLRPWYSGPVMGVAAPTAFTVPVPTVLVNSVWPSQAKLLTYVLGVFS